MHLYPPRFIYSSSPYCIQHPHHENASNCLQFDFARGFPLALLSTRSVYIQTVRLPIAKFSHILRQRLFLPYIKFRIPPLSSNLKFGEKIFIPLPKFIHHSRTSLFKKTNSSSTINITISSIEIDFTLNFRSFSGELLIGSPPEPRSQKFLWVGHTAPATRIGDLSIYRVTRFDMGERLESICKIPRVMVRKVSERGRREGGETAFNQQEKTKDLTTF